MRDYRIYGIRALPLVTLLAVTSNELVGKGVLAGEALTPGPDHSAPASASASLKGADTARICLEKAIGKPAAQEEESLKELINAVVRQCLAESGSQELWDQAGALPFTVAVHAGTGRPVQLTYFCSDICPDYGGVLITLEGVPPEECCDIGAVPLRDPGWGGYRGCVPADLATDWEKSRSECAKPTIEADGGALNLR